MTAEGQCGGKNNTNMKVSSRHGHVVFHLDSYSKTELKELKDKFLSDLQRIRKFINRIESGTCVVKKKTVTGQKRTMPVVSSDKETKRRRLDNAAEAEAAAAMMRKCGVMLARLMKHKHGWVFNEPVDVVALNLPDYHQVVKRPMDLGTVKLKLVKRVYGTPLDFAKDVRLTFDNALLYNRKGDDVHTMATVLLDMFDKLFDPAYEKYEVEHHKCSKPLAEFTQSQLVSSQRDTEKSLPMHPQPALPRKICKEAAKKSASKQKRTVPEAKENPPSRKKMSDGERDKLGRVLQDLAGEYLNEILQIVAKRNSKMTTPGEDGEIELDVHALDTETMWDLHRFVSLQLNADQNRTMKEELTSQSTLTLENNKYPVAITHEPAMPTTVEDDIDIGDEMPVNDYPPLVIERDNTPGPACNVRSSSSSSSSSGTDSSSDSDSSSGSDSEISDAA